MSMKKFAYSGPPPEELFVAVAEEGFRIYVSEQQALRWIGKSLSANKKAELVKYTKTSYENK